MRKFVFLEFIDPKVSTFLSDLRSTLQGKVSKSPVHVTIRGPYVEPPSAKLIQGLQEAVQGFVS